MESAASGLVSAIGMQRYLNASEPIDFTRKTVLGSLAHYIADYAGNDFQPMNANFGIMEGMPDIRDKKKRYEAVVLRAKNELTNIIKQYCL